MRLDYRYENLAPKGEELHELLVEYAEAYLYFNIDAPVNYVHRDVQYGDDERGIKIADAALIPDGSDRSHPYKSIAVECGNLTGDAVEHLVYAAEFFDVVGWLPYPLYHKLDKYQEDRLDILMELKIRKVLLGSADIVHPKNIIEQDGNRFIPKRDAYYFCVFPDDFGKLEVPRVLVYLISLKKENLIKNGGFGLFPFGTADVHLRNNSHSHDNIPQRR